MGLGTKLSNLQLHYFEKHQRRNEQEKRRGWDSNPSVPYDTTGLEPAAYRLQRVTRLRWISPLCHPGTEV